MIFFGGAVGIGSALLLGRLLVSTLVGVTAHDTLSFGLAWALMTRGDVYRRPGAPGGAAA